MEGVGHATELEEASDDRRDLADPNAPSHQGGLGSEAEEALQPG
jgi:hypothetical protein